MLFKFNLGSLTRLPSVHTSVWIEYQTNGDIGINTFSMLSQMKPATHLSYIQAGFNS